MSNERGMWNAEEARRQVEAGPGWIFVFQQLAPVYADAIARLSHHVDCPFPERHGEGKGSKKFRFFADFDTSGNAICTCCPGTSFTAFELLELAGVGTNIGYVCARIKQLLESGKAKAAPARPQVSSADPYAADNTAEKIGRRKRMLSVMHRDAYELSSPEAEPARLYFQKRGLQVPKSDAVLYVPKCVFSDARDDLTNFEAEVPAVIAMVRQADNQPATYHRHYITEGGEKFSSYQDRGNTIEVKDPKRTMPAIIKGSLSDSAVRLYDLGDDTLNVTEGIENGQAIHEITGGSVWCALVANRLERLTIPKRFKRVVIWADRDPYDRNVPASGAGQKAAYKLGKRLVEGGFKVEIMLPNKKLLKAEKIDWEDVAVKHLLMTNNHEQRLSMAFSFAVPELIRFNDYLKKRASLKAA